MAVNTSDEEQCSVCLECESSMEEQWLCNHKVCKKCFDTMISMSMMNQVCPICRANLSHDRYHERCLALLEILNARKDLNVCDDSSDDEDEYPAAPPVPIPSRYHVSKRDVIELFEGIGIGIGLLVCGKILQVILKRR